LVKKNQREEKDLVLGEIIKKRTSNFGLIKIYKRVQYLMEKIQLTDMEL